jgi:hypothetical protein
MMLVLKAIPQNQLVLWTWPQWYSAMRYVALLLQWLCELYCQTT